MKMITRAIIANMMLGYIVAFYSPFSFSKTIPELQGKEWILLAWAGISIIGFFFVWGHFFHHWGIHEFINKKIKRIWFWVLLLGAMLYFVGPLVYYIIVYEIGKGLERES